MKTKLINYFVFTLLVGSMFSFDSLAQESEANNYKMRFKFNTIKQADSSRLLEVSFIGTNKKNRKDKVPVFEADIEFYNVFNEKEVKLGITKTDEDGLAQLTLLEDQSYLLDEEGYINFKAVFEGTDGLKSKDEDIAVKDIFLELQLKEIDSVKTVILNAYSLNSLQTKVPVEELDVVFSVGGMISKMPIEEGTLVDGEYKFEFPNDLPGDKNGNIDVYVSILDHDDFGNVIIHKKINWGNLNKQVSTKRNTLWSAAAPIWMYIVLTILLVGVWANYIYSFIHLYKINKEGKNLKPKEG